MFDERIEGLKQEARDELALAIVFTGEHMDETADLRDCLEHIDKARDMIATALHDVEKEEHPDDMPPLVRVRIAALNEERVVRCDRHGEESLGQWLADRTVQSGDSIEVRIDDVTKGWNE